MKMNNESIDFRIEKLEFDKEEVEDEMKSTEKIIQELKVMTDKIPVKEVSIKVSSLIRDLENDVSNNEELKEQIEKDITSVRGF